MLVKQVNIIIQDVKVISPIKKERGQKKLSPSRQTFSSAASKIRQPIESLFTWISKKTEIQNASCVRSARDLVSHIFRRFAAAMIVRYHPLFAPPKPAKPFIFKYKRAGPRCQAAGRRT